MAHPNVVVGERYSFPNPNNKRSLLTGTIRTIHNINTNNGTCLVTANDGKCHTVLITDARKPRTRRIRRDRRAIERGEL